MNNNPEKLRVVFFGTPDFAVPTLRALLSMPKIEVRCVVTQPDRPAGRGRDLRPSPVKAEALKANLPILQPESVKKGGAVFVKALEAFGPFDIGVVIAFGQLLPKSLLSLPVFGCVNLHASLLPRWRGAAPIQRAIMAGDRKTGVCLMKMEPALDTGPVFSRETVEIKRDDNFGTLHDSLAMLSAALLARDLEKICKGNLTAELQEESGTTYAHKILEQEALIDWSKTATEINSLIRGLSPVPGAFTMLQGKRLKIYRAQVKKSMSGRTTEPGQVQAVDKNMLEIMCADENLSLIEVQLEGKQRMPIGIFLNGHSLKCGARMGE